MTDLQLMVAAHSYWTCVAKAVDADLASFRGKQRATLTKGSESIECHKWLADAILKLYWKQEKDK